MKVAIYIENSIQQIILTPENDFEKNVVKSIMDKELDVTFKTGSFEQCQGDYIRYYGGSTYPFNTYNDYMMVIKEKSK